MLCKWLSYTRVCRLQLVQSCWQGNCEVLPAFLESAHIAACSQYNVHRRIHAAMRCREARSPSAVASAQGKPQSSAITDAGRWTLTAVMHDQLQANRGLDQGVDQILIPAASLRRTAPDPMSSQQHPCSGGVQVCDWTTAPTWGPG